MFAPVTALVKKSLTVPVLYFKLLPKKHPSFSGVFYCAVSPAFFRTKLHF